VGIIKKQGFLHSLVNYVGVGISFISTLFIYNLDLELYGFAQFLTNTAAFLIPFMTFGVMGLILRYYPEFKDPTGKSNFIKFVARLMGLAFLAFLLIYVVGKEQFIAIMKYLRIDRMSILDDYLDYVVVLALMLAIVRMLSIHSSNLKRIVVPEILHNLGYKLTLPALVLLGYYGFIQKDQIVWLIIGFFALVAVLLFIYVNYLKGFEGKMLSWLTISSEKRQEIRSFTAFSAMNGLSASFAFRIDMIMLSAMLGFTSNGIYAILLFLTNIIDIPRKSLARILSPFLASASQSNDHGELGRLYKKASITLLVPGMLVFLIIYSALPELDKIVSGDPIFWDNRYLFICVAIGRLIDMLLSMNTEIITYSRYYKFNLLFVIILGVSNVMMNYWLINEFELLGSTLLNVDHPVDGFRPRGGRAKVVEAFRNGGLAVFGGDLDEDRVLRTEEFGEFEPNVREVAGDA